MTNGPSPAGFLEITPGVWRTQVIDRTGKARTLEIAVTGLRPIPGTIHMVVTAWESRPDGDRATASKHRSFADALAAGLTRMGQTSGAG